MFRCLYYFWIRNPLVISPLLGILVAFSKIHIPIFVSSFCHQIGMTAGSCALFAIGQALVNKRIFDKKIELSLVAFFKLIVHPALMFLMILVFRLSDFWAASGFVLSSLPTATVVFIVAQKYQTYEERASTLVFETTLLSILTLTISISFAFYMWPQVFIK